MGKKNIEKIEVKGRVERDEATPSQIFFYNEVNLLLDELFDGKSSKSAIVNFLVLHLAGKIDLTKVKKVNVYDIEKLLNEKSD